MILLCGCSLLQPDITVTLRLPEPPAQWRQAFTRLDCEVWYVDGSGTVVHTDIREGWGEISVPLYKGYNSFVLAYPVVPGQGVRLRPAGALYPLHLKKTGGNALVLSWEAGVVASVYKRLWEQGVDVSDFNTARLLEVIAEKAPDDPWQIDTDLLAEHIAERDFTYYDIKPLPAEDTAVAVPGDDWFLESPFSGIFSNEAGAELNIEDLSLGFHRLFGLGTGTRYDLYLSEYDCVVVRP